MTHSYHIEPINKKTYAHLKDLVLLHKKLLPMSPVVRFGDRFTKKFYYNDLIKAGNIFAAVAYINKQPAGFISATYDSNGFMHSAVRKFWWKLVRIIGITILYNPKIIPSIWETVRFMRSRKKKDFGQLEGEILSIGVLPEYSNFQFIQKTGIRIADDLLNKTILQMRSNKINFIRAFVDVENSSAYLFYHGHGWRPRQMDISGWQVPVLEFVWHEKKTCEE
jgi:ribosomal protein S18 acetylase RimI-like enzyme